MSSLTFTLFLVYPKRLTIVPEASHPQITLNACSGRVREEYPRKHYTSLLHTTSLSQGRSDPRGSFPPRNRACDFHRTRLEPPCQSFYFVLDVYLLDWDITSNITLIICRSLFPFSLYMSSSSARSLTSTAFDYKLRAGLELYPRKFLKLLNWDTVD